MNTRFALPDVGSHRANRKLDLSTLLYGREEALGPYVGKLIREVKDGFLRDCVSYNLRFEE